MLRIALATALVGALALGACTAAPPTGPSVMALPAKGKSFEEFQQDDAACQQFASQAIGNTSPSGGATESAIGSAAVGTGVGAAAGAALGAAAGNPAMGAAIGAGAGLLGGSAVGVGNARASSASIQQRYDMRYLQCMAAKGESVPTAVGGSVPHYGRPYGPYAYGPYGYPPPYPGYYYYPGP